MGLIAVATAVESVTQREVDAYGHALEAIMRAGCAPESLAPLVDLEAVAAPRTMTGEPLAHPDNLSPAEREVWVSAGLCEVWAGAEPDQGYVAEASDPQRGVLMRVPVRGPEYRDKATLAAYGLIATDPRQLERYVPLGPWLRYYRFDLERHEDRVVATRIEVVHLGQDVGQIRRMVSAPSRRASGAALPRDELLLEARLWLHWGNVRQKVPWAKRAAYVLPSDLQWESRTSIPVTCDATECRREEPTGWVLRVPATGRRALKALTPLLAQDPSDLVATLDAIRAAGQVSRGRLDKTLTEVAPRFAGDPSIALVALNTLVQRAAFDAATSAVDDLHTHLGPDPYLHVLRCELALELGHWGEGQRHCASAVEQQPRLIRPYWTMIRQASIRGDHAVSAAWMNRVRSAQGVTERDLRELPYLEAFLASPEGEQMVQDWRRAELGPE